LPPTSILAGAAAVGAIEASVTVGRRSRICHVIGVVAESLETTAPHVDRISAADRTIAPSGVAIAASAPLTGPVPIEKET
jgi:hypothetical protein